MATRSTNQRRGKLVENQVSKYLWGERHLRTWKERHDVSGPDAEGNVWIGEVKARELTTIGTLWTTLVKAFAQAEGYGERAFAVVVVKGTEVSRGLTMVRMCEEPVVLTLERFRARLIEQGEEQ